MYHRIRDIRSRLFICALVLSTGTGCVQLPAEDEPSPSPSSSPRSTTVPVPTVAPMQTPTPAFSRVCGSATEGASILLACPAGLSVSSVEFASFGNPGGSCGGFNLGSCHASSSVSQVSALCNGRSACTIDATNAVFGDPCSGVVKELRVQVVCGNGSPLPTPTPTPSNCTTPPSVSAARYFVAPDGNDGNPGTYCAPFRSWDKLSSVMVAGDRAYIRGGTYRVGKPANVNARVEFKNLLGTAALPIQIWAYPGEKPVVSLEDVVYTGSPQGLLLSNSHYVHLKGLRVMNLPQRVGYTPAGLVIENSTHNTLELLEVDHIGGYGLALNNGAYDNLIKNCDVHHFADPLSANPWGGANGFNITGYVDATRNVIDGCRAWCGSDDGYDLFGTNGIVTIKNSWSFWNGYECLEDGTRIARGDGVGFKLGPTASDAVRLNLTRIIQNNLSFENRYAGFDQNSARTLFHVYNNTSFKNGSFGYFFGHDLGIPQVFRNNISFQDPTNWGDDITGSNNTWNGLVTVSSTDFQSLSSIGADGPRQADGSLPNLPFMKLAPGSDLIDAGTNVGLPYSSGNPDMGCFESN